MSAKRLRVPTDALNLTISSMRAAGGRRSEGVVLWLGRNEGNTLSICEVYVPDYLAASDFFYIPPPAMSELLGHLGHTETMIAAQVHSHPKDAFHSEADGRWAIVRHEGALSLVLPRFAVDTTAANFMDRVAAFRLNASNAWTEIPRFDLDSIMEVR